MAPASATATLGQPTHSGQAPIDSRGGRPGPSGPSAWDEPPLVDPVTIDLSSAAATQYNDSWALPQNQDYRFTCPTNPVVLPHNLSIWGGRNVVIEGCDIETTAGEAAYPHNQGNELWLANDDFQAAPGTTLGQGIQLQEPGNVTVVMRDVLIGSQLQGSFSTNHAECIQTWAGPQRFLIDGFTCQTTYQGLYLLPNQWYTGPAPSVWDFRNVDIDDSQGGYALWVSDQDGAFPLNVQNVYVVPNPARTSRGWWLWGFDGEDSNTPGVGTWADATAGAPPGGHYVQAVPDGATGVDEGQSPVPLSGEQP